MVDLHYRLNELNLNIKALHESLRDGKIKNELSDSQVNNWVYTLEESLSNLKFSLEREKEWLGVFQRKN